jgi:hypothetical protein
VIFIAELLGDYEQSVNPIVRMRESENLKMQAALSSGLFFSVISVFPVLNAFKDLTQRTLREDTEVSESLQRPFLIPYFHLHDGFDAPVRDKPYHCNQNIQRERYPRVHVGHRNR